MRGESILADGEGLGAQARLIARNTVLNLLGQGIPLLIGLIVVPVVARGLGADRFGLLSLAWMIVGYITIFDLGLGRATTKYVAEMLVIGKSKEVPSVVWTSLFAQLILGLVGTCVFALLVPVLVTRVFKIPSSLQEEARMMFYVLAFGLPLILIPTSLSGALEAKQRFDLTNAVRVPFTLILYIAPLLGALFGLSLPIVMGFVVGARALAIVALLFFNNTVYPEFYRPRASGAMLRQLIGFGGWITVSAIVGPVLVYGERFLLSVLAPVAAVGYYSVPLDALTRLWLIPGSLSMTLFPVFSEVAAVKDYQKARILVTSSMRILTAVLLPLLLIIITFAHELLWWWLGPEFARQSTMALQIASLGLFVNSLATLPYVLIQGAGRADLTGRFHLVELPIYLVLSVVLIRNFGITGAAWAWTARLILDALLLFGTALLLLRWRPPIFLPGQIIRPAGAVTVMMLVLFLIKNLADKTGCVLTYLALAVFALGASYILAWLFILDNRERCFIRQRLKITGL